MLGLKFISKKFSAEKWPIVIKRNTAFNKLIPVNIFCSCMVVKINEKLQTFFWNFFLLVKTP